MVVGEGHILDQNLAHHADARFAQSLINGKIVKGFHNAAANRFVRPLALAADQRIDGDFQPLLMKGVGGTLLFFIGTHPVQAAHEQVAVDHAPQGGEQKAGGELEALVGLHAVGVQGDDRDMAKPRLVQRPTDEADIVARPAAAAGLGHHHGQLVRVVFPGKHRVHDLPHHGDGGEAGIVVYEFQTHVDGGAVVVGKHFDVVAVLLENRFQQVKVNGAHLGGEDGVAGLVHFLGEFRPVISGGLGLGADAPRLTLVHGGQQTADADTGSPQIVHLVDFQDGVELVAALQNFAHLIGGDSVQTAAEGIQLNQLQVLPVPYKFRRTVQPGMVDPLVVDPEGAFGGEIDGQTVLGEDGEIVGGNHFRDAVVDLRVDVVGSARENDATGVIVRHPLQCLLPLRPDVGLGVLLFRPRIMDSGADFLTVNAPLFLAQGSQPVGGDFLAGKGEEGTDVADFAVCDGFHVVFQILRVGDHDGAVVMILRAGGLLMLIEYAGVEDGLDALVDEPLHMAVGELGGVALGFRGDGLHAKFIDFPAGLGGEDYPEAQFPEECRPEGVVFVHIQHSGNADDAPGGIFQREIVEHPLQLIGHHVGAFPPGAGAA